MAYTIFRCLRSTDIYSIRSMDSLLPSVVQSLRSFRSRDTLNFTHFSLSFWPYRRFSQISGPTNANISSFEPVDNIDTGKYVSEGVLHVNEKAGKPFLHIRQGVSQISQKPWSFLMDKKQKMYFILAILQEIEVTGVTLEQASKLDSWLKESLQPWQGRVNKYAANHILQCLENKPPLAFSFLNWIRSQPDLVLDKYILCTFMKILAKGKHFTLLENILSSFNSLSGEGALNEVPFTIVMKAWADDHQFDKMLKTYNQMLAAEVHPTEYTFSVVIRGLIKARRNSEAIEFFEKVKKFNCRFNLHLYGELISLFGILRQPERAAALLEEMTANGQPPNVIVYTRLIQAYCKANLHEEALAVLGEMKLAKVSPNSVTYLTLIDFFSKQNDVEQVKRLFHEARCEAGLQLDTFVYNGLINMYVKIGEMSEAENLVAAMKADGLTPDHVTYTILLSGYLKREMFSSAKGTLAIMKKEFGFINTFTYTSLLTLCLECTSEAAVVSLVDCMEASDHWLHKVLLQLSMSPQDSCEEEIFWNGIVGELKKLTVESATLASTTIMSIVAFLAKLGLENRARRFWKEARMQGFLAGLQCQDSSAWKIDLHNLHPLAVKPVIVVEFSHLRKILEAGKIPEEIHIVTGWGRTREGPFSGDSIQMRVANILQKMQSPFRKMQGNGGCQAARGQEVWTWLQSQRTRTWLAIK